jgi:hypothetical protein
MVAGGDQDLTANDGISVCCLFDGYAAKSIQAFGESSGELFGHVLQD